jgi:hypothetical protein
MRHIQHMAAVVACLGAMWAGPSAWAGAVQSGEPLPELQIKDQHDKDWRVSADTRVVLFAAGRKASNLVQAVLAQKPRGFMAERRAVYVADMSKMPAFATRMFALPALREQPFDVGVVLDAKVMTEWPRKDDAVTLIRLDQGRVVGHEFVDSEAALTAALAL